jgi:hypothetical protein
VGLLTINELSGLGWWTVYEPGSRVPYYPWSGHESAGAMRLEDRWREREARRVTGITSPAFDWRGYVRENYQRLVAPGALERARRQQQRVSRARRARRPRTLVPRRSPRPYHGMTAEELEEIRSSQATERFFGPWVGPRITSVLGPASRRDVSPRTQLGPTLHELRTPEGERLVQHVREVTLPFEWGRPEGLPHRPGSTSMGVPTLYQPARGVVAPAPVYHGAM